jgi:arylsulfatase A-like enzyme
MNSIPLGLLGLALPIAVAPPATASSPPNVLMIVVDDLKPALGCYGDTRAITPNIDRLAARGKVLLNAHCQQAVCGPSRASALTGLRPDTLGITRFGINMRETRRDLITVPEFFKDQGYESIGMGKIFDGRNSDGWDTQDRPSWTRRIPIHLPNLTFDYGAPETRARIEAAFPAAVEGGYAHDRERVMAEARTKPSFERLDVADDFYADGLMAREAANLILQLAKGGRPFFLAVGFQKPHLPFAVPERYWAMHDPKTIHPPGASETPRDSPPYALSNMGELRAYSDIPDAGPIPIQKQRELIHGYHAAVTYLDAQVGRVLDAVTETGLEKSTIIVLWGDHGFHLGDHGLFGKHTNYEQATRSPLIFTGPGVRPGHVGHPVELIDIFPTLVRLAGFPAPPGIDGHDLFGTVSKNPVAVSQFPRTSEEGANLMGYAFRDVRHRYVAWIDPSTRKVVAEELFDYQTDPSESRNLAPASPDELERMRTAARTMRPDLFP